MKKSTSYKVRGFDDVSLEVDTDWTGEATIRWRVAGSMRELVLPAEILQKISAKEGAQIMTENVDWFISCLGDPPS